MAFVKTLLIIVILSVMVIILLGIGHFFSDQFHTGMDDTDELRRDIAENDDVIGEKSVFHDLVDKSTATPKGSHTATGR